jgi:hypothetical protein
VLFAGSIGRTDFPGGDFDTLIASITQRLWPMGDDTVFIPGHGPESSFGRERRFNPYLAAPDDGPDDMPRPKPPSPTTCRTAPLSDGVRALAQRGELCRFAKGAVLIQEGAVGDTLYIVLSGKLRVFGSHMANEREITHGTYGPG